MVNIKSSGNILALTIILKKALDFFIRLVSFIFKKYLLRHVSPIISELASGTVGKLL
ncbi:MAG: hypothetical protein OEX98_06955 [Nitrosopumilus sp.]|nr:hypothetical protein [Nitrosopumilus sp.]